MNIQKLKQRKLFLLSFLLLVPLLACGNAFSLGIVKFTMPNGWNVAEKGINSISFVNNGAFININYKHFKGDFDNFHNNEALSLKKEGEIIKDSTLLINGNSWAIIEYKTKDGFHCVNSFTVKQNYIIACLYTASKDDLNTYYKLLNNIEINVE